MRTDKAVNLIQPLATTSEKDDRERCLRLPIRNASFSKSLKQRADICNLSLARDVVGELSTRSTWRTDQIAVWVIQEVPVSGQIPDANRRTPNLSGAVALDDSIAILIGVGVTFSRDIERHAPRGIGQIRESVGASASESEEYIPAWETYHLKQSVTVNLNIKTAHAGKNECDVYMLWWAAATVACA